MKVYNTARRQNTDQVSTCKQCHTRFSRHGKNPGIYCSMACKAAWQRTQKPVDRDWLYQKYIVEGLDCTQIGKLVSRDPKSVWNWLKDLEIPTRQRGSYEHLRFRKGQKSPFTGRIHTDEVKEKIRQARKITPTLPHLTGGKHYLDDKHGPLHPNWKGGTTPVRQKLYSTQEWKDAVKAVWHRADAHCERCNLDHRTIDRTKMRFHVHHIDGFENEVKRCDITNLALLCSACHHFVHSRKNTTKEFRVKVVDQAFGDNWALYNSDSSEVLHGLPDESVDLSCYSPPFASLYTYSNSDRDLGNSADRAEFFTHYAFIIREMLRLTKPGRHTAVHVQQLVKTIGHDGVIGLTDFRGDVIRAYEAEGWIFHGEITIDKNPQQAAVRTHSKGLLFVQLRKDASWLRPGLADYLLVFRKPGENQVPIKPDISNEDWITWAHPVWYNIREADTLNTAVAKENEDERHICALQLPVIERCVRLWSNPGETILDPFAGLSSTGFVAIKHKRKYIGIELKSSYYKTGVRNLERASAMQGFDLASFLEPKSVHTEED